MICAAPLLRWPRTLRWSKRTGPGPCYSPATRWRPKAARSKKPSTTPSRSCASTQRTGWTTSATPPTTRPTGGLSSSSSCRPTKPPEELTLPERRADPPERRLHVFAAVERADPDVALAAAPEARHGRADDLGLFEEQVEELP